MYIRVISVTIPTEPDFIVCIHPYPIDTEDTNVIRDPDNNALYFPVTNEDIVRGSKRYIGLLVPSYIYVQVFFLSSFRLIRKKILQSELKLYESLRILDSSKFEKQMKFNNSFFLFVCLDRRHIFRTTNRSRGKELIKTYSLWKSQLAFCAAEMIDGMNFKIHTTSMVFTQVMTDEMYQAKGNSS